MRSGVILALALAAVAAGCREAKPNGMASTGVAAPASVAGSPQAGEARWIDVAWLTRTSLNGAPSTREPVIRQSVSNEPKPEWAILDLWKYRLQDTETGAELVLTEVSSPGPHQIDARDLKLSDGTFFADFLGDYRSLPVYEVTGGGKTFAPGCDGDADHVVTVGQSGLLILSLYFFKGRPDSGTAMTCGPAWFQYAPCDGPAEVREAMKKQVVFDDMCVNGRTEAPSASR